MLGGCGNRQAASQSDGLHWDRIFGPPKLPVNESPPWTERRAFGAGFSDRVLGEF